MPVSLEFEGDGVGVIITASGNTQASEFLNVNKQMYIPDVMKNMRYQLVDLTAVEQVDTSFESIRRIAESDKEAAEKVPGLKIAIVVKPGVMEGFAQIYSRIAKSENLQTKIFSSAKKAQQWVEMFVEMDISA